MLNLYALCYSQELVSMTTRFTDDLMEQGLTQKILTLVSQIDLNNEFDKLQRERGLGSEKHRKEVKRGLGVITLPSDCIGKNAVRSQGDIFSPYLLVFFLPTFWFLFSASGSWVTSWDTKVTTLQCTLYHCVIEITTSISVSVLLLFIRTHIIFTEGEKIRAV